MRNYLIHDLFYFWSKNLNIVCENYGWERALSLSREMSVN